MLMMSFCADWEKVLSSIQEGSLWQAMDEDDSWSKTLDCLPESLDTYTLVAEAYEQLRPALPDDFRQQTDAFFHGLITAENYCQDFGGQVESDVWVLSLSPESVARFKAAGDAVDFEQLHDAFYSGCREDTRKELGACAGVRAGKSFEKVFLPYVRSWCEALNLAADEGKGILVKWG